MRLSKLTRPWARAFQRSLKTALKAAPKVAKAAARKTARKSARKTVGSAAGTALRKSLRPQAPAAQRVGSGSWLPGLAIGSTGARRYRLYKPPGMTAGQSLPLMVMLHGCGQDAQSFADSTRMNALARQQRFIVLYPEQDRMANAQGCWNWFDTRSGRAQAEAASIMAAIDQVCALHGADRTRVAVAGLSAGASMATLLATRYPGRFKAVAMHSGVPPGTAHSTLTALGAMRGRRAPSALAAATPASPALPPLLVLHGLADNVVAPANGEAAVRVWAEAAGAVAQPRRYAQRGQRYPCAITDFRQGRQACATLVEVAALGHAWSGGAARQPYGDAKGPDATRMVWAFVRKALGS